MSQLPSSSLTTQARPAPRVDPEGRLDQDARCVRCGYNLRGLLPSGDCPECGIIVSSSLKSELLAFADRHWVASLIAGINWMAWSMIIGFALQAMIALFVSIGAPSVYRYMSQFGIVFIAARYYGVWRFTGCEADRLGRESRLPARWVARISEGALLGWPLRSLIVDLDLPLSADQVLWLINAVLAITGIIALLSYARSIARRIPDRKLERLGTIAMWGMVLVRVLRHGIYFVLSMLPLMSTPDRQLLFVVPLGLAGLISTALIFVFWFKLRNAIRGSTRSPLASPSRDSGG